MDRARAAELKDLLLDVGDALGSAAGAMVRFGGDERDVLLTDIQEVYEIVYERLLKRIYDGHPELAPPPETPHLSSELSWDEVSLPSSVSATEIDRIIFSVMQPRLAQDGDGCDLGDQAVREDQFTDQ